MTSVALRGVRVRDPGEVAQPQARRERRRVETPELDRGREGAARLRGPQASGELPAVGRTRRAANGTIELGAIGPKDRSIALSTATGRFLIDGDAEGLRKGKLRDGLAAYLAAKISSERGSVFGEIPASPQVRRKVLDSLTGVLEGSIGGRRTELRDKAFTGSMSLLLSLVAKTPAGQPEIRREAIDAAISGVARTKNIEHAAFYYLSLEDLLPKMTVAQKQAMKAIEGRVLPKKPLIEEYTANRTKPLEVRHHVHHEFWHEELRLFSKKNGWELVRKNAKDTFREYRAKIEDPTGKKAPLTVHMTVKKGELDFLDDISDPNVHIILYSGHSAVGGNGSQSIQAAGRMVGKHPKLVLAANCRGKDNYAEFTNKWPDAHVIMTAHATYSDSGQARIAGLFETLARGESYAWMRKQTEEPYWDEPADNYFYPDERRKFRFMDSDEDGKIDISKIGVDKLFDVDLDIAGGKFVRALNFTNSELHYHWEVDEHNGLRSHYGKQWGDSLIADGPITDPKPGELVRVREVEVRGERGGREKAYRVQYAPDLAKRLDQNLLAAHVTFHTVLQLAKIRDGEVNRKEELRAALMGAQAIHYLDVYVDTQPATFKKYMREIGLVRDVDARDMERIFEKFDAHANDAHVAGFREMLEKKYGVDVDAWAPRFRGAPVTV